MATCCECNLGAKSSTVKDIDEPRSTGRGETLACPDHMTNALITLRPGRTAFGPASRRRGEASQVLELGGHIGAERRIRSVPWAAS